MLVQCLTTTLPGAGVVSTYLSHIFQMRRVHCTTVQILFVQR